MIKDELLLSNLMYPENVHQILTAKLVRLGMSGDKDLTNVIDLAVERSAARDNVGTIKAAEELELMLRTRLAAQRK